MSCS
jgi:hypothetical protein